MICINELPRTGIEARGLIFGSSVALALGAKFVPLRKPNKLPGNLYTLNVQILCGVYFLSEILNIISIRLIFFM